MPLSCSVQIHTAPVYLSLSSVCPSNVSHARRRGAGVVLCALLVLFSLLLPLQAWAGLDEGMAAFKRMDYTTALQEWRPLAQAGDANAQFYLGYMYDWGSGVRVDYAQAVLWYRRAAEQGNALAQFGLGDMYAEGLGVPQDYAQAATWWRRAAAQGHDGAQYNLGGMYAEGRGVPQDDAQAALWWRRAAAQGHFFAQYNLGLIYEQGQGVPQDYQQAYFWLNLAAAYTPAEFAKIFKVSPEILMRARDRVAAHLTPAQLAEAQAQARTWQPKPETPSVPPASAPARAPNPAPLRRTR